MSTKSSSAAAIPAEIREGAGKGVARALRRAGKVPGILYSKGTEPVSLALPAKELRMQYLQGRFRSRVVELDFGKEKVKALPRDVQFHPVTDVIEHVDFQRIDPTTVIHVFVPVKFLNSEKSVGIKRGGVLNVVRHEIEFVCRPDAIPTVIEIDIAAMNIGDSIHINDVKLPDGVRASIKRNFTVATIAGRNTKEEEPAPAAAAAPAADAKAADAKAAPKKDDKK